MLEFSAVPVTDATAHAMLTDYFASRAETFPAGPAAYRTVFPVPEQFIAPLGVFLVAQDGDEAVGCGGIRRLTAERYEVKHLWTPPEARGRGYGRAVLAELERRARELGAQDVVLDTNRSQREAGGLYLSSGYSEVEPYNDNPNANAWYAKRL
jgi:GNAT superfamily N-acetyltransferase